MNRAKRMAVIFLIQLGLGLLGSVVALAIIYLAVNHKLFALIAVVLCGLLVSSWWLSKFGE